MDHSCTHARTRNGNGIRSQCATTANERWTASPPRGCARRTCANNCDDWDGTTSRTTPSSGFSLDDDATRERDEENDDDDDHDHDDHDDDDDDDDATTARLDSNRREEEKIDVVRMNAEYARLWSSKAGAPAVVSGETRQKVGFAEKFRASDEREAAATAATTASDATYASRGKSPSDRLTITTL